MKLFELLMWLNVDSEHPSTGVPVILEDKPLTWAEYDAQSQSIILHTTPKPEVTTEETEPHDHS